MVKNLPANAGDVRDTGLTLGLGRAHGGGHSNPLQDSYLQNPMTEHGTDFLNVSETATYGT